MRVKSNAFGAGIEDTSLTDHGGATTRVCRAALPFLIRSCPSRHKT